MNNTEIKRIIAHEGLVVLGITVFGLLLFILGKHIPELWAMKEGQYTLIPEMPFCEFMLRSGKLFILFGYPFYLLVRFIIWAVRTLRAK